MARVSEADVILPLVDGDIFYRQNQGGKKQTSSLMWGIGFRKKMILYRPLADVFGIQEDNVTYFLHDDSKDFSSFTIAFGRCLNQLFGVVDG